MNITDDHLNDRTGQQIKEALNALAQGTVPCASAEPSNTENRPLCSSCSIPPAVQERLDRTYAALGQIPQLAQGTVPGAARPRRARRGVAAALIAAACVMFGGAAFAATNLLEMTSGNASFFANHNELPVFSTMEEGARLLSADVGQSTTIGNTTITLDTISCDRNVANLYLTLEQPGGINLEDYSIYEGSKEGDWAKLQSIMPILSFKMSGNDGAECEGDVRRLDAYLEDGAVKCLMRVVPTYTMPTQVQLSISAWDLDQSDVIPAFNVGLDMESIPEVRELGAQDVTFDTAQGAKTLQITRFTASELATVMVAQPSEDDANGDLIAAEYVKIVDNEGNTLVGVAPGDGQGISEGSPTILEYAGLSDTATSVTFTPILEDANALRAQQQENIQRVQENPTATYPSADQRTSFNVTEPDAKIPTSDLGGYTLESWSVKDETVTFLLKPYGWVLPGIAPELLTDTVAPMLAEQWADPNTGASGIGYHAAIAYDKWDYATGEVMVIHSYYNATQAELEAIREYYIHPLLAGAYTEAIDSAITLMFKS